MKVWRNWNHRNGKVKQYGHCGKVCLSLEKFIMELPYGQEIPLLDIHPRERQTCLHKSGYTSVHGSTGQYRGKK